MAIDAAWSVWEQGIVDLDALDRSLRFSIDPADTVLVDDVDDYEAPLSLWKNDASLVKLALLPPAPAPAEKAPARKQAPFRQPALTSFFAVRGPSLRIKEGAVAKQKAVVARPCCNCTSRPCDAGYCACVRANMACVGAACAHGGRCGNTAAKRTVVVRRAWCSCKKTQCLKLYCVCFANGLKSCGAKCECVGCGLNR
jgi:hypothetical protein